MNSEYVFVYGSLKRGGKHNYLLKGNSEFLGNTMAIGYALYKQPFRNVPVMVYKNTAYLQSTVGEIYAITAERLARLDQLEGIRWHWYSRRKIETALGWCWAYVWPHPTWGFKRL